MRTDYHYSRYIAKWLREQFLSQICFIRTDAFIRWETKHQLPPIGNMLSAETDIIFNCVLTLYIQRPAQMRAWCGMSLTARSLDPAFRREDGFDAWSTNFVSKVWVLSSSGINFRVFKSMCYWVGQGSLFYCLRSPRKFVPIVGLLVSSGKNGDVSRWEPATRRSRLPDDARTPIRTEEKRPTDTLCERTSSAVVCNVYIWKPRSKWALGFCVNVVTPIPVSWSRTNTTHLIIILIFDYANYWILHTNLYYTHSLLIIHPVKYYFNHIFLNLNDNTFLINSQF